MYSHKRRIRKRRRSESSDRTSTVTPTTNRARLLKITKLVDQSQRSEYQSELNDTKTDINRTLTSLADVSVSEIRTLSGGSSFGTESNVSSLAIEFSQYARSAFKSKVSKAHILKHSEDFSGILKCHVIKQNDLGKDKYKIMTRKTLFALIYCALNYHKEPIEIGDLMRFCREGHLSFHCARKFIPRNLSATEVEELQKKYTFSHKTDVNQHNGWRDFVHQMTQYLDIQLEQPDLYALAHRYVDELNLPDTIYKYVERMLVLCPSMVNTEHSIPFLPSCEARAMAYILFVLKLLFGLDDTTEFELSKATRVVNKHLERHESKFKLFVWSEWVEFIEARTSLIIKCYAPSAMRTSSQSADHYLQYMHMKLYQPDEEFSTEEVKHMENTQKKSRLRTESLNQFAKYMSEVDDSRNMETIGKNLIKFPPSLTPNKTYMEIIREKYADKLQISPILLVDHTKRDIKSFLEPLDLYKEVLRTRTKLDLQEACTNSNLKFMRWTNETLKNAFITCNALDFNISETKWEQKLKRSVKKYEMLCLEDSNKTHNRRKMKFLQRKATNRLQPDPKTYTDTNQLLFDPYQKFSLSDPCASEYDSILTLKLPHFYYWTNYFYSYRSIANTDLHLYEDIAENFPQSFIWLLNHCANMIEMKSNELYSQLLIVENQFLYALKPMTKLRTKLQYRSKKQLPRKMHKVVNQFKNLW